MAVAGGLDDDILLSRLLKLKFRVGSEEAVYIAKHFASCQFPGMVRAQWGQQFPVELIRVYGMPDTLYGMCRCIISLAACRSLLCSILKPVYIASLRSPQLLFLPFLDLPSKKFPVLSHDHPCEQYVPFAFSPSRRPVSSQWPLLRKGWENYGLGRRVLSFGTRLQSGCIYV